MSKKGRYVELIRLHILVNCMELRWRQPCSDPVAPCVIKKGEERKKKRDVLHLFRCYTHTHKNMRFLHVSSRYHHINSITMTSPLLLKLISPHFIHLVLQLTSGKTTKQYQISPNIFKHQKQSQPTAFSKGIQAA